MNTWDTQQPATSAAAGAKRGPALLGQFGQGWFRTSDLAGEINAAGYSEGDTVTLCGECVADMLL